MPLGQKPRPFDHSEYIFDIERTFRINAIDHTERVERYLVPVQHVSGGDELCQTSFAALVNAQAIVQ